MFEKIFSLKSNNTTFRRELLAGCITFFAMSYIIVVNPIILSKSGMDFKALFMVTCIIAATGSIIMGLFANIPFALAPGMGLNAFFAYTVVLGMGKPWQLALAAVFLSGVIFFIISITRVRGWLIDKMPEVLKTGITCGVGLFIMLLGLENSGIIVGQPSTLVTLGNVMNPTVMLSFFGVIALSALTYFRVHGASLIVILSLTAIGLLFGFVEYKGIFSAPVSIAPIAFKLSFKDIWDVAFVTILISIFLSDFFDATGTLIGLSKQAGVADIVKNSPKKFKRALMADSFTNMISGLLGSSAVTPFAESATGINAGGRTGLTAVVVGILFLLSMFLSPLASMIPAWAVSPVLMFVAVLMLSPLKQLNYDDITDIVPTILTIVMIPLTFSIGTGIGVGFISYTLLKLLSGKFKDLNISVWLISMVFTVYFIIH